MSYEDHDVPRKDVAMNANGTTVVVEEIREEDETTRTISSNRSGTDEDYQIEMTEIKIDIEDFDGDPEITEKHSPDLSDPEEDYKIDKLFYRIFHFCLILGVNFYRDRNIKLRCVSLVIVAVACSINVYFIGYVALLCMSQRFEAKRVATSVSIFISYWQWTSQPCKVVKLLYEVNKGIGIHHHRKSLQTIVNTFYVVVATSVCYYVGIVLATLFDYQVGYLDRQIPMIFGHRHLFIIVQLAILYCIMCWGVALFIFSLLVHATHYEFVYFNDPVRSLQPRDKHSILEPICTSDHSVDQTCDFPSEKIKCDNAYQTDETLCSYLLKLIKIHNGLTECVKSLDKMFNRYAFVMLVTIIPTTIFSLFMIVHQPDNNHIIFPLIVSFFLVFFCIFSFITLVNAPSQLHNTIHKTKLALCANTHIWFPYRPNVYHSAIAFLCHLDQANLGVSIWGFAIVTKPLVLTTLSAMVTCLALFVQIGECNADYVTPLSLMGTK